MAEMVIIQLTKDELKALIRESVEALLKQAKTISTDVVPEDGLLKIDEVLYFYWQ